MKKESSAVSVYVNKKQSKKQKESLAVVPPKQKEVLRIENDGRVFWLKNGKMTQAKIDKELAMAFAYVVASLSGFPVDKLVKNIKKQ